MPTDTTQASALALATLRRISALEQRWRAYQRRYPAGADLPAPRQAASPLTVSTTTQEA